MKRVTVVCALFGILVAGAKGQAQILKPTIGAGGGPAFPVGNLTHIDNGGFNVLVFGGVDSGLLPIGVRIDGAFVHLPIKFGAGHDNLWSATANLTLKIPAPLVTPYLIGGAGYYYIDASPALGSSSSKFGLNAGAGAAVHIPLLFAVFGEFRYHYVINGRQNMPYIPITIGIQL
jgi:opacity protein-like surface antigen